MDMDELIDKAKGDIWGSALRCDFEGYLPPGVEDWLYGDPPITYLRSGEQPHFNGIAEDRVLKLRVEERTELEEVSRFEFERIQEGRMYDGWTGYLSSDPSYCSIFLVTDQRVLIFVGQDGGDQVIEFPFEDPDFTAIRASPEVPVLPGNSISTALYADGYEYNLQAFSPIFRETNLQTIVNIFGPEIKVNHPRLQDSDERGKPMKNPETEATQSSLPDISVSDLLLVTPTGFENYVADIWRKNGYDCKLTSKSADDGIDIIADDEDTRVLIQVKRYSDQSIGIESVQRMAGLLVDKEYQADEVVIATTSSFSKNARRRARKIDNLKILTGDQIIQRGNESGLHLKTEEGDPIYETEVSHSDILDILGPDPLRTDEIQNTLDANWKSLDQKLKEMHDEGKIKGKHIGNNRYIWYLSTQ